MSSQVASSTKKQAAKPVPKGKEGAVVPPYPKRPLNAIFLYKQHNYELYRKKHGTKSLPEITAALCAEYKALPDEQKKKYEDMFKVDLERYRKDKDAWEKLYGKIPVKTAKRKAEMIAAIVSESIKNKNTTSSSKAKAETKNTKKKVASSSSKPSTSSGKKKKDESEEESDSDDDSDEDSESEEEPPKKEAAKGKKKAAAPAKPAGKVKTNTDEAKKAKPAAKAESKAKEESEEESGEESESSS